MPAPRHNKNQGLHQYKDGSWGVDCMIGSKRHREKVGSWSEARTRLAELKSKPNTVSRETSRPKPLSHWLSEFSSATNNRDSKRYAARWSSKIGNLYPEQFGAKEIQEYTRSRIKAGRKPSTIYRELAALQGAYTLAVRAGALSIASNPFANRKALRLPRVDNEIGQQLSYQQKLAVKSAIGGRWWPYVLFSLLTGVRFSSLRNLKWPDVDLAKSRMTLVNTKNGKSYTCHLSSLACKLLSKQKELYPCSEYCWPGASGKKLESNNFRNRVWKPAFVAAGLPDSFRWHDLRHTAACDLIQAGEDLATVREALTQEDYRTTQRYARLASKQLRKAADTLADLNPE